MSDCSNSRLKSYAKPETNYEKYFGTPERTLKTVKLLRDSDNHPVAINIWYCGTCEQVNGDCDEKCEKHELDWLRMPAAGVER